jgi:hypothetical protein
VLVQVAVPSRGDVEEYQNLRTTVNELVGRINGQFGSIEFMPIHYMHQSVDFTELVALYNVSDVCLVSSTRDGMNLVLSPLPLSATFFMPLDTSNTNDRSHTSISALNSNATG